MSYMALSEKRLGDIVRFAEVAQANGWDEGTDLPRSKMAIEIGMSEWTLSRVISAIKENPDLGLSVSTARGNHPWTVVTFAGDRVNEEVIATVHEISEAKATENFKRTVRDASTSFVAYQKADKTRTRAKQMRPYVHRLRGFLMSMREQAVEDSDPFAIREMTERALAVVGVHYDGDADS